MADEPIGQNLAEPALPGRQEEAARLVAEDDLTNEEIATKVGVKRQTLDWWKTKPAFAARVAEHKEAFRNAALTEGFADKRARLKALDGLAQDMLRHFRDKGYEREEVKIAANGEHVSYYLFDQSRVAQFRGTLDDIAKEIGDRKTINETTHKFDQRKEAEAIAAEIGKADDPTVVERIHQDLLINQEAR